MRTENVNGKNSFWLLALGLWPLALSVNPSVCGGRHGVRRKWLRRTVARNGPEMQDAISTLGMLVSGGTRMFNTSSVFCNSYWIQQQRCGHLAKYIMDRSRPRPRGLRSNSRRVVRTDSETIAE